MVIFSILGIVGGLRIIEKGDTFNAGLMIFAGVWVLFCVGVYHPAWAILSTPFIISAIFFFLGWALIYLKKG